MIASIPVAIILCNSFSILYCYLLIFFIQKRCFAWVFYLPQNQQPICFLKGWIPVQNPKAGCTSGVLTNDPLLPPRLPPQFYYSASVQEIPKNDGRSGGYTSILNAYYDFDNSSYVTYESLTNGDLRIKLYRYDLKKFYEVNQTISGNISCLSTALSGSLFPPTILQTLQYIGSGVLLELVPVTIFFGTPQG